MHILICCADLFVCQSLLLFSSGRSGLLGAADATSTSALHSGHITAAGTGRSGTRFTRYV